MTILSAVHLTPAGRADFALGRGFWRARLPGPVVLRFLLFIVLWSCSARRWGLWRPLGWTDHVIRRSDEELVLLGADQGGGTLLAAWVMSRLEGRRLGEYGLPWRGRQGKLFLQGALFGIAEIATIIGVLAAAGYYSFGSLEVHGASLVKWTVFWAAVFVVVGFFEEYAFRGYGQFALTRGFGFWAATL